MKVAMQLTLDGIMRALRLKAHAIGDEYEGTRHTTRERRQRARALANPRVAGYDQQGKETADEFSR